MEHTGIVASASLDFKGQLSVRNLVCDCRGVGRFAAQLMQQSRVMPQLNARPSVMASMVNADTIPIALLNSPLAFCAAKAFSFCCDISKTSMSATIRRRSGLHSFTRNRPKLSMSAASRYLRGRSSSRAIASMPSLTFRTGRRY